MKKRRIVLGMAMLILSGMFHGAASNIYSASKCPGPLLILHVALAVAAGVSGLVILLRYELKLTGTTLREAALLFREQRQTKKQHKDFLEDTKNGRIEQ